MITIGLDVRYVWIGSLYIIQDDLRDWEIESAKMSSVYGLSYLTIAVLHSPDSHGGCFLTRVIGESLDNAMAHYPCIQTDSMPISTRRGNTISVLMSRIAQRRAHTNFFSFDKWNCSPLESRAWALQERLLAPRTLLIYPQELVWECKTTADCACRGLQPDRSMPLADDEHMGDLKALIQPCNNLTAFEAGGNWCRIISVFSKMRLTNYDDTLPALAGLATHFSQFTKGSYLAGMWSDELPRLLLWDHPQEEGAVDESRPSWSWIAVHPIPISDSSHLWGVHYDYCLRAGDFAADPDFKFVSFTRTNSPSSGFVTCGGGVLRVSGRMTRINKLVNFEDNDLFARFHVSGRYGYSIYRYFDVNRDPDDTFQLLLLARSPKNSCDSSTHFLILKPVGRPRRYRRV